LVVLQVNAHDSEFIIFNLIFAGVEVQIDERIKLAQKQIIIDNLLEIVFFMRFIMELFIYPV
jgi:hypothetical protein